MMSKNFAVLGSALTLLAAACASQAEPDQASTADEVKTSASGARYTAGSTVDFGSLYCSGVLSTIAAIPRGDGLWDGKLKVRSQVSGDSVVDGVTLSFANGDAGSGSLTITGPALSLESATSEKAGIKATYGMRGSFANESAWTCVVRRDPCRDARMTKCGTADCVEGVNRLREICNRCAPPVGGGLDACANSTRGGCGTKECAERKQRDRVDCCPN